MIRTDKSANYTAWFDSGITLRMPIDPARPITELAYPEFYDVGLGTACDARCPWCVIGSTLISTTSGTKKIEDVVVGDVVFVLDESTGLQEQRPVEQKHVRDYTGDLVDIELESGETLSITPNHKLLTQRGWIPAGDLTTEDTLLEIE
jgi:hypothetical protein